MDGGHVRRCRMNMAEEMDQFQVLEEKIDKLIELIGILKREKESLAEKVQIQEERLSDLNGQLETLRGAKDQARQRIVRLLEKIERVAG
jgi:chromosome segregation ATPase